MKTLFLFFWLGLTAGALAQIGMGGQPHPSAVLDLKSPTNNQGLLIPRLSTAQRNAIASPAVGLLVFDLDKGTLFLHDGQNWLPLATTNTNNLLPIERTASDAADNNNFGYSVAISGDYAIVGAYGKTIGTNARQGAAYVFIRIGNTWTQQAILTASDGTANDYFGYDVAISGDYIIVGAIRKLIGSNTNQGAAYVFVRSGTTWTQQARLVASDGAANDSFGFSVALSGNYAIVGANQKTVGSNTNQGAAYAFLRSGITWTQQARLTANDGALGDYFGSSVAISGDYVVIGASQKTIGSNSYQGAAYVFVRGGGTWTQQARLTASDGANNDFFGRSVSIDGDYVVVGALYKVINATINQGGAAYVFTRNGNAWSQQIRLTASDVASPDNFGSGVAISGDYVLIGASSKTINGNILQGAAYLFQRINSTWTQIRRITDNSPSRTYYGFAVGISNGSFIIGGYGFENLKGKVGFGTVD
ncbi:FG-GAP repeat protein [Rudanella lutea]|uniref:FG-GAP repeat protein n=1 Tax=Rudanella lutea TaxID=451374 RepID=UPI00039F20B3|nr:FG-GAP repeat protein [Rudanella lutea]